jgi:hypothetical protein
MGYPTAIGKGETTVDNLTKWSAYIVDLRSLFSEWERRNQAGAKWTRRFREIHSICMFTLCVEHNSPQRYLIGFQNPDRVSEGVTIGRLFDGDIGEVENCDFLLVDDPKGNIAAGVLHHRCQVVSFVNQPETSELAWASFLEKRKLKVPRDDDLRLVIHIEQGGRFNYEFLHLFLTHRSPQCPYSQVFVFGQTGDAPRKWSCKLVYPDLAIFPDLTEEDAKALILDREQYSKPRESNCLEYWPLRNQ